MVQNAMNPTVSTIEERIKAFQSHHGVHRRLFQRNKYCLWCSSQSALRWTRSWLNSIRVPVPSHLVDLANIIGGSRHKRLSHLPASFLCPERSVKSSFQCCALPSQVVLLAESRSRTVTRTSISDRTVSALRLLGASIIAVKDVVKDLAHVRSTEYSV